jgi:hypothetical protein
MAEKKVYFDSGFTNAVKKTSDKSPDVRINITLSPDTLDAIIAAGGKMQLAGWNVNYGKGDTTNWKASADTFVKQAGEPAKANGYQPEAFEDDIPF